VAWLIAILAALAVHDHMRHKGQPVPQEHKEEPIWDEWSTSEARHVLRGLPDEE
jgi:hypothetical protein